MINIPLDIAVKAQASKVTVIQVRCLDLCQTQWVYVINEITTCFTASLIEAEIKSLSVLSCYLKEQLLSC